MRSKCHHHRPPAALGGQDEGAAGSVRSPPTPRPARSSRHSPALQRVLSEPGLEVPGGGDPSKYLATQEAFWKAMRRRGPKPRAPTVVRTTQMQYRAPVDYDVAVAGGTLGIFLATALQLRGLRVAVVERGRVQGRTQEWNISRAEVATLVGTGVLTRKELEEAIASEFNPTRVALHGAAPIEVRDVLNVGVCPATAVDRARRRFEAAGGVVLEGATVRGAVVHPNAVVLETAATRSGTVAASSGGGDPGSDHGRGAPSGAQTASDGRPSDAVQTSVRRPPAPAAGAPGSSPPRPVAASLLIDTMGHWSPIVAQLRRGARPDRVVMVVGGCVDGVPPAANVAGDLLATLGDAADDMQLFWEAFPARDGGRTLYAFAYLDAHPDRPSFEAMLDRYLDGIPAYQGVALEELRFKRLLLAAFPCYPDASPLKPGFDRILQVGDAAASQSPLSFGGFGSMLRHLPRLTQGVEQAVRSDSLSRGALGWLQPSSPTLSSAWLFQGAMAPRIGQLARPGSRPGAPLRGPGWLPPDHVNRLLRCAFGVLQWLGPWALRPFLQDTLLFLPLSATMAGMALRDPGTILRVVRQLGPWEVLSWARHYLALGLATLLDALLWPLRGQLQGSYRWRRVLDAVHWGSGADYHDH
ncbi:hypothetical protein APUTEX25_003628 [Auxenochlorella protothecoides]|nr:hypothetical protein APUTEX25_003628 [Auxenochlorella protothecoides]|eukprot:RMZ52485.1 hypothetical protein APUTEX25_003628 [Auxenochlorella protothecoides]